MKGDTRLILTGNLVANSEISKENITNSIDTSLACYMSELAS